MIQSQGIRINGAMMAVGYLRGDMVKKRAVYQHPEEAQIQIEERTAVKCPVVASGDNQRAKQRYLSRSPGQSVHARY